MSCLGCFLAFLFALTFVVVWTLRIIDWFSNDNSRP